MRNCRIADSVEGSRVRKDCGMLHVCIRLSLASYGSHTASLKESEEPIASCVAPPSYGP